MGSGEFPVLTAFLLGLLVALHPCPLAANIAAMGYIAKDMDGSMRVLRNGLLYAFGRVLGYALLGTVLIAVIRQGADVLHVSGGFGKWGERVLVAILIGAGLWMLLNPFMHKHEHVPPLARTARALHGASGSMLLGVLLALAFCPESAIVYFGMLIPMSADSSAGYLLPVVFAVGTSLPPVILAWTFAYGVAGIPALRARMNKVQKWMNSVVGVIFITAGIFCLFF